VVRKTIDHGRQGNLNDWAAIPAGDDVQSERSAIQPVQPSDQLNSSRSAHRLRVEAPIDAHGNSLEAPRPVGPGRIEDEDAWLRGQQAGLALLFDLAVQVPPAIPEALAAIAPTDDVWPAVPSTVRERRDSLDAPATPPVQAAQRAGTRSRLGARLRGDHLVRNSLYLMLSSGLQSALGFTFWIIMARLFTTDDVGRASSLVSATTLMAFFALFGLNSTLVRYLPTAENRNSLITGALLLVAGCGGVIALIYVLLTPIFAPRLSFISSRPVLAMGFVLLTAAAAVNLLTDSVFIASRKASLCALTDGGVGGLSKIVFGLILAGSGTYGLFAASAGGFSTAALVSIILIVTTLHWRPSFREPFRALKPLLRFSGANYVANVLNLLPSVVVPIIVLDRLGAESAAYYFVSFQMAALVYAAVQAVEQAFLAEGSQAEADWRKIRNRSRRIAIVLFVPGCVVLALTARWVLLAFGPRYSQHGSTGLELLAVAVIPIAFCNWSWTVLRLSGRLRTLVFSNAVFAIAICGGAWVLASHGLTALTAAWPIGCTIAAAVATVATSLLSPKPPGRHRRPAQRRAPASQLGKMPAGG
jgi:O-antigen/teichoic acid export membrane protein